MGSDDEFQSFQEIPTKMPEGVRLILAPFCLHPEVIYEKIVEEGRQWSVTRRLHAKGRVGLI